MNSHRSFPVLLLRLAVMASAAAMLYLCATAVHAATWTPAVISNVASTSDSDYRLGSGDKVHVVVFGEDDLGGDYEIDGSGYIRMPLIGQLRAAGISARTLGANIGDLLQKGYLNNPNVSVEVITYRPFYIIGAVNRPGQYPYVNNMNALNAVALAGGFTEQAKESVVYVRREGSTVETRLPADQSTVIHPGDVVRVDTTLFWDAVSVISPISGLSAIAATRY